jgi:phosphate starvation-inducible protein PhoH
MTKRSVPTATTKTTVAKTKKKKIEDNGEGFETKANLLSQIKLVLKHKNENQKKLTQSIKDNDVTICTGSAGTGKAQPLDSLILTPNGYVTMGSIKLGDNVIGVNGNPIKVDGVYPKGEKEIYLITFSDGTSTECCGEHLWFTQTDLDRKKIKLGDETNKYGSVKNTIEIMNSLLVGDDLAKLNHTIPIVKPINFIKKQVVLEPYSLGCLLSNIDYRVNTILDSSDNNAIPEEYLINDVTTRIELLQGLLDTEGSVDESSGTPVFYSISEKLIENVMFLIQSLGGTAIKTEEINDIYKLNINLPSDMVPFKSETKIRLLKQKNKHHPIRYIKNVELKGNKEVQCISVDDNNHLYLTNDCIVTHNTYLSCLQSLLEIKSDNKINKIVLVKSVTTLKTEEIGFLKGSMEEKMEPFMYSFTGNFEKLIGGGLFKKLKENQIIQILPIAYLRGVNIDNAIVIIDEAQNISIDNLRTILTRLGENSKMVFLGDTKQIDVKNKYDSALGFLIENFKTINNIGIVEFTKEDIIRHKLIKVIEDVFDKLEEEKKIKNTIRPKIAHKQIIVKPKNTILERIKNLF